MKTGRELFEIWAPRGAVWSPWVAPALFAQMGCLDQYRHEPAAKSTFLWHQTEHSSETAVILDLPGAESVKAGLALARIGYRPVPLINASPEPTRAASTGTAHSHAVLDMRSVVEEIGVATRWLQELAIAPDAPAVFILDSRRATGTQPLRDDLFDNRWMVFPQDFPSARFLAEHQIRRVVLVQTRRTQPLEDLSHVLRRWQEAGVAIFATAAAEAATPSPIMVARPSRFRTMWYRAAAMLGLQRSSVGGFGSFLPHSFGGG
jgi:hypothetical protein